MKNADSLCKAYGLDALVALFDSDFKVDEKMPMGTLIALGCNITIYIWYRTKMIRLPRSHQRHLRRIFVINCLRVEWSNGCLWPLSQRVYPM